MNSLSDRYVWAVLQAAPRGQRAELEPEIRTLVADTIAAHAAHAAHAGAGADDKDAERAALTELGDPTVLAARYSNQSLYLIGPRFYPAWRRLLGVLLPIVVPVIAIIVLAANLAAGSSVGQAIVAAGGAAFSVGVQTAFWFTIVFAIMERTTRPDASSIGTWSLDELPELPDDGRMGVGEFAATLVFQVVILGALLWVQLQPPIVIDGQSFTLFDPRLWSFWLPWFIVVLVGEIGLAIALFIRGRWTIPFAVANALLGVAFAIPAIYLIANDLLLDPALVAKISESAGSTWLGVTGTIVMVIIAVLTAWDAIDGFRKARRAANPPFAAGVGK